MNLYKIIIRELVVFLILGQRQFVCVLILILYLQQDVDDGRYDQFFRRRVGFYFVCLKLFYLLGGFNCFNIKKYKVFIIRERDNKMEALQVYEWIIGYMLIYFFFVKRKIYFNYFLMINCQRLKKNIM